VLKFVRIIARKGIAASNLCQVPSREYGSANPIDGDKSRQSKQVGMGAALDHAPVVEHQDFIHILQLN